MLDPMTLEEAPPQPRVNWGPGGKNDDGLPTHYWRAYANANGLNIERWVVVKETPRGVWVDKYPRSLIRGYDHNPGKYGAKLVLHDAKKQWACPTKAKAVYSWRRRMAFRRMHLQRGLDNIDMAEQALANEEET